MGATDWWVTTALPAPEELGWVREHLPITDHLIIEQNTNMHSLLCTPFTSKANLKGTGKEFNTFKETAIPYKL